MKQLTILLLAAVLAFAGLTGCAVAATPSVSEDPASPSAAPASQEEKSVVDDEDNEDDTSGTEEEAEEEQSPIFAAQILDGTYSIQVKSSSSMFRIVDAQLSVAGEEMTAVLTLSGTGYEKLYMGTGDEALADSDDMCIYYVEDGEGMYTYEVPVTALDMEIDVAAWSIRKQQWYDRVLVFQSALLPADAVTRP